MTWRDRDAPMWPQVFIYLMAIGGVIATTHLLGECMFPSNPHHHRYHHPATPDAR